MILARRERIPSCPSLRAVCLSRVAPHGRWARIGVLSKVIFRLCAMSVVAWLAGRLFRSPRAAYLIAMATSALLFGLAHLPAWLAVTRGSKSGRRGLAAQRRGWALPGWVLALGVAVCHVCHLFADAVVQGLGPRLFRSVRSQRLGEEGSSMTGAS